MVPQFKTQTPVVRSHPLRSCDLLTDQPADNNWKPRSNQKPVTTGWFWRVNKSRQVSGELKFPTRNWQRVVSQAFQGFILYADHSHVEAKSQGDKTQNLQYFWPDQTEDKALASRVTRIREGILERRALDSGYELCPSLWQLLLSMCVRSRPRTSQLKTEGAEERLELLLPQAK